MPRVVPFGAFDGFSDLPVTGTHFYSQGFIPSLFGLGTQYSILDKVTSAGIPGLGSPLHFTVFNGYLVVQDDSGQIWMETTRGAYNFTLVRNPGGNGAGLMADQYGNLFYACGASNNQLGKYDGTTWNDTFQTLTSGQHPMTWYEDLVLVVDGYNVDCLFSDGTWSNTAFSLPTQMNITAIKSGPTGILIGANLNNQGAIILWDGNALRSKVPWKWTAGQILAIDTYGENWIVKTQREALITNGTTISEMFGVFDDPLSFNNYDNSNVLPQQMALVNDVLIFCITSQSGNVAQYGKMKPGVYLYSLSRKGWSYLPVGSGATFNVRVNALYVDTTNNRIVVGYSAGGVNYVSAFIPQGPTRAQFISEELGLGRIKYQRTFFGPTDKTLEAVVLNLGILNSMTQAQSLSFSASVKVYNFKRQLWGHAVTSGQLTNMTVTGTYNAQVGDEVTILEGNNAGSIGHITVIANNGASNETWTLDTTFANQTAEGINVQVQPFTLVKRQTFTNLSELKNVFFSVNSIKGKQFLIKVVLDGIEPTLNLELLMCYWVFNDLGYTQT